MELDKIATFAPRWGGSRRCWSRTDRKPLHWTPLPDNPTAGCPGTSTGHVPAPSLPQGNSGISSLRLSSPASLIQRGKRKKAIELREIDREEAKFKSRWNLLCDFLLCLTQGHTLPSVPGIYIPAIMGEWFLVLLSPQFSIYNWQIAWPVSSIWCLQYYLPILDFVISWKKKFSPVIPECSYYFRLAPTASREEGQVGVGLLHAESKGADPCSQTDGEPVVRLTASLKNDRGPLLFEYS